MHAIEGGMITTGDASSAERLRLLRNQGMAGQYQYEIVGLNARMSDVAAAVGRVQLSQLAHRTAARRSNAAWLTDNLHRVTTPTIQPGAIHVFHQYVIRVTARDEVARKLERAGIRTAVHYPIPVHRTPAYLRDVPLPYTDRAAAEVLSLPVHPSLHSDDLTRIAGAVNAL
jgi:dTDP-4-amino-4,6-dideoxygalactose transaminase